MLPTEKSEELLEILWSEIVEHARPDVDATLLKDDLSLRELVERGLVARADQRVRLTERGRTAAAGCVRRHRLAERLFADVLAIRGRLLHETSCTFEHALHEGVDESICTLLGHPRTCPHGHAIPEGRCCREARKHADRLVIPLADLEPERRAVIAYLQTHDREALQKLLAMGALPKAAIRVLQRRPTLVFEIGNSQFAIDDELASHVFVRCRDAAPAERAAKGKSAGWRRLLAGRRKTPHPGE